MQQLLHHPPYNCMSCSNHYKPNAYSQAERQALVSRLRDAEVTAQARRDAEQRVCELESAIAAVKDRAREMVSELRAQRCGGLSCLCVPSGCCLACSTSAADGLQRYHSICSSSQADQCGGLWIGHMSTSQTNPS